MKRTFYYLQLSVLGNALGTALMEESNIGMTAWGSSALNTSNLLHISIGSGFVLLSVIFYSLALIISRSFNWKKMVFSFIFLFTYAYCTDFFLFLIPSILSLNIWFRIMINITGLLILLFSIAVHLKIQIAVHPMDVYLHVLQEKLGITVGTYTAYFSAFSVGIICGLLFGAIEGIGVGTILTLLLSGYVMKFYNEKILIKWKFN